MSTAAPKPVMTSEEAMSWAELTVDGRGMPIDRGIIRLVAGLHRYGIETEMSCEGHQTWGSGYPWIRFSGKDNNQAVSSLTEMVPALGQFEVYYPNPDTNHDLGYCELRPQDLPPKLKLRPCRGALDVLYLRAGMRELMAAERQEAGERISGVDRLRVRIASLKTRYNRALWLTLLEPFERWRQEPVEQAFRDACQGKMPTWRPAIEAAADQLLADDTKAS